MFRGKKYQDAAKQIEKNTLYEAAEGFGLICKTASAKFDETVELHVKLGVDSRHADQQVRGAVVLPNGTGKKVRTLVFCKADKEQAAKDAGADYIVTQMFFNNANFYEFEKKCREAGITVPIIPGLKPISTFRQTELLPQSFSIDIPLELSDELSRSRDDKDACYRIGQEWCKEQCRDLIRHGVPAIHFYTMGKASNVINILKECF